MGKPKRADTVFVLGAIVNDKAFLNHKWLKIGDSIGGYMLTDINDKSVTLVQGDRTIHIFMRKSKTILQLNKG